VYSILRGHVDGKFPSKAKKPSRFDQACRDFEKEDPNVWARTIRVHIPRVLIALYEVRNNRSVGHVGGDVDPNHMDSVWVLASVKWVMAELVRIFHNVDVVTATATVEALTTRTIPSIWEVGRQRRVLHHDMSMKDKMLLLLYGLAGPASEKDLVSWTEHSNASVFRRDVIKPAHKRKLIEYDATEKIVHLSPTGARYVEENVPLEV
jgi:hypothetical protein